MYDPLQVAHLTKEIIEFVGTKDMDVGVKMAACRSAGDIIGQTIVAQGMAGLLNNIINGDRK